MDYKKKDCSFRFAIRIHIFRMRLKEGKEILLEGQLGTLKDPDFGIYPMVTSSSTLAGYGCVGAGIPANRIKDIVVVTKAYSVLSEQANLFRKSLMKMKHRSFASTAAIKANSALQQEDRAV